jgi:hypothetical protein
METAREQGTNPWWFKSMVDYKMPWDFKAQHPKYQDFGNFHYGATGDAAGFPSPVLKGAAGLAHLKNGSEPSHWWSWFDDSRDTGFIKQGIEFNRLYESGRCRP